MANLDIVHTTGLRMRVVGEGDLKMRLLSLDAVEEQVLVPFALETRTAKPLFRLANFQQPGTQLELSQTELDDRMRVNSIIIYVKPVFAEYPA